MNVLLL
jgi:hypothetical protein